MSAAAHTAQHFPPNPNPSPHAHRSRRHARPGFPARLARWRGACSRGRPDHAGAHPRRCNGQRLGPPGTRRPRRYHRPAADRIARRRSRGDAGFRGLRQRWIPGSSAANDGRALGPRRGTRRARRLCRPSRGHHAEGRADGARRIVGHGRGRTHRSRPRGAQLRRDRGARRRGQGSHRPAQQALRSGARRQRLCRRRLRPGRRAALLRTGRAGPARRRRRPRAFGRRRPLSVPWSPPPRSRSRMRC